MNENVKNLAKEILISKIKQYSSGGGRAENLVPSPTLIGTWWPLCVKLAEEIHKL